MERTQFFRLLHIELSLKYGVSEKVIGNIRCKHIGFNMTREDIMDWADEFIRKAKKSKTLAKPFYYILFDFLEDISDEDWNDIVQITEYDKKIDVGRYHL